MYYSNSEGPIAKMLEKKLVAASKITIFQLMNDTKPFERDSFAS